MHTTRTKCDETCNGQLASSTATTRVRHTSIEDGTGRSCVSASASRCAANTCALDSLHDDAVHALGVRHKGTAKKDNEDEEEEEEDEEETAEAAASSSSPDGIINFSATIVHESQQEGIALRDHRFRVSGQPVGVGAFGAVYRALDLETGIIVAVKQSRYSVDHNRVSLSWREFKTWSMLPSHTNVITFHGASHEAETQQLLLVLEYASGGSISSLYREYGPIPEHIFRRHAREMAQGLQHLHNHNVVHGDVKPENVLTRSDGSVAISDFGCSRLPFCPVAASRPADRSHMEGGGGGGRRGSRSATALGAGANAAGASCGLCDRADATHAGDEVGEDDEYATRQICGTVAYMAPEVINSASVLKSDVWAYACSLLQLYLDTLPWTTTANIQDTHEPLALMYFIATHEAAIPYSEEQIYSAPRWLQKIANRAFKRDLASRCTMGEVLSILTEYND